MVVSIAGTAYLNDDLENLLNQKNLEELNR